MGDLGARDSGEEREFPVKYGVWIDSVVGAEAGAGARSVLDNSPRNF